MKRPLIVTAAATLFLGLALPMSAQAAATDTTTDSTITACVYDVFADPTPVRENPDTGSVVRKYKYWMETVTGPCQEVLDVESGIHFTAVYCTCATDGIGWIRSAHLI
jgi:hypothetical protein